jgi:hypothetical protein
MNSLALQREVLKMSQISFWLQPRVLGTLGASQSDPFGGSPSLISFRFSFPRAEARGYSTRYIVQFVLRPINTFLFSSLLVREGRGKLGAGQQLAGAELSAKGKLHMWSPINN